MKTIVARCQCGAKLQLGIKIAGKICRCPKCKIGFAVPSLEVFEQSPEHIIPLRCSASAVDQQARAEVKPCSSELALRFEQLRIAIEQNADEKILRSTLADWLEAGDANVPYKFIRWPINSILETPFDVFSKSWSSNTRLQRLLTLLERARTAALSHTGVVDESTKTRSHVSMDSDPNERHLAFSGTIWRGWCEIIEAHDLAGTTLGALAPSLNDIPVSYWNRPLREFTSKSYVELSETPGLGFTKVSAIVGVVREVAKVLGTIPAESTLGVILLPKPIRNINLWLLELLIDRRVPTTDEIGTSFCRPLLHQLQADLSPDVAAIVMRRIGLQQTTETLAEIADDVGLTRERVRQLVSRATQVLQVRWPQGKHLLDDLYDLLSSAPEAHNQVAMIRTILDRCFDVDFAVQASRGEVLDAFRAAARRKLTPMSEGDVVSWAATEFRRISPDLAFTWISSISPIWTDGDNQRYYFSDDPWESVLLRLLSDRKPMLLSEVATFVDDDQRNIAGRVSRDLRFIRVDDGQVQAAYHCGVQRIDGEWYVELHPQAPGSVPTVPRITIASLIDVLLSGFLQLDIADATVWGVHRYANQILESLYNGGLPGQLTPFMLQEILVTHSRGRVRRMRRRRLRWDADHTIPARGKIGWISFVSCLAGVPMTIEEMHKELKRYYQDYEPYVLQQLNIDEEDGEAAIGIHSFAGVPHRIPPLIVPNEWALDCNTENVSKQLKLIASKIVDIGRRGGYPKTVLLEIPWMVALVEHYAFGKMNWSTERHEDRMDGGNGPSEPRSDSEKNLSLSSVAEEVEVSQTLESADNDSSNIRSIIQQLDGLL